MVASINSNVRNNNNLAWKNLTVVDLEDECTGGSVMIANPSNTLQAYRIEVRREGKERSGDAKEDVAAVTLQMDNVVFNAWKRGGEQVHMLEQAADQPTNQPTKQTKQGSKQLFQQESKQADETRKQVTGDNARLDNIMLGPNEGGLLSFTFDVATQERSDETELVYHVIQ